MLKYGVSRREKKNVKKQKYETQTFCEWIQENLNVRNHTKRTQNKETNIKMSKVNEIRQNKKRSLLLSISNNL